MNYCILNGVSSATISGLLISSLPPVSKPLIRTEIEEIDGRDGDIVTKLGYSAYDKEMTIGLFGNFDVDEVIAFFNSEGTVTFSNEPDKYYNYQIINQINFERLIRFRTATVTFHVQPFKYAQGERPVSMASGASSLTVHNSGNTMSKPVVTLTGNGSVMIDVNGMDAMTVDLGGGLTVTLDVANMEAYNDDGLQNRRCSGDFDNLALQTGDNVITWSGNVTGLTVYDYSRWV